jgi:hypothetical protein
VSADVFPCVAGSLASASADASAATAATVADRWPDNAVARDLTHQLVGLSAILLLHFRKEEEDPRQLSLF